MTLSPETTNFTQRQDIERRVPEVEQALQAIVRGFKNDVDLLAQVLAFAYNFVASRRPDDTRTESERQQQAQEVVEAITAAGNLMDIAGELRAIYQQGFYSTPQTRTQQLLDLIARAVATIQANA